MGVHAELQSLEVAQESAQHIQLLASQGVRTPRARIINIMQFLLLVILGFPGSQEFLFGREAFSLDRLVPSVQLDWQLQHVPMRYDREDIP
eukprot:392780-Amphidinium_carterae.1